MIRIVWGVLLLALCSIAASGQSCILTLNPVTGLFDCKTAAGASTGINNPGVNGIVVCTGTACSGTTAGSLTGDVTTSGLAATIAAGAVTNAKLAGGIDLTTKVINALPAANFPALTGDVTNSAGSLATAIGAGKVTNTMLAGSIDLATKVTGILPATSHPALTGDITTPSGSVVTTLASVVSASTCGDATHSCGLTYDAKGRITAATNNVITGTGGSGFTNVFDAVRTSSTVLTFGANCSTTTPCVVHQWDSYLIVQQSFTVTITPGGSASTLHLYGMNGIIYAGITSGAAGLTCSAGCTAVPNETDFPSQVSRLYSWTANVTPGNWDTATPISSGNPTNGYVDYRGIVHSAPIDQGEGVVPLISGNRMILSVDATIIPRWYSQAGAPTSGAGQCSSGRDIDTNTSNNDFYNCVGTAWNKVTGSSGGTGIGPVTHISTTSTTNTVTHNFGAADVVWGCDDGSGIQVIPTSIALNTNTSVFTFATALTTTCRVVGGSATVPLTTKGDLFTFDTANQRLAVGANGTVLTADSTAATGIKWATVSGTGTVTSVGLVGTANQLTVTGTSPITGSGSWTISIPSSPTLPGTTTGTFSGNLTGNVTGNTSGTSGSTTGNAATATALQTARAINGTNFDGTAPITVTAAAGTLTGTTLNATVVTSSLTSVGTLAGLTATGAVDFGGSSSTKIRVAAGLTTATNGFVGYDSTNNMLHGAQSGADAFIPQFTATPANNDCVKWTVSGSNYKLGTAGAACGTGGTVTVVSAGSLTSTALTTGGGSQTIQTPCANCTLDSSGNMLTPGTISSGAGGSVGGAMGLGQGTATTAASGVVGWMAPTSVTTPYYMKLPAAPTTGFLLNTGTTDPSTITFVSAISLTSQVTGTLPLANGGTNGTDSASNGGIIWSNASGYKVLAGTATANQVLLSGSTATPAWSSATYPASTTANRILYSSATNTVGQITSLANGVLVTDGSSVPSIQVSLPSGLAATNFSLTTPTVTGIMSYQANIRQTFNPGSTVAGLNIGAVAVAPSTPINGDIWYDSTGNKFKCQEGSSTVNCIGSTTTLPFTSITGIATPAQLSATVNAQTGTTYTVADSDRGKLVTISNASAIATTLPQAGGSGNFISGWYAYFETRGAGAMTITPTTSTIDGAATLVLTQNQGVTVFSDGTNYFTGNRGISGAGTGCVPVGSSTQVLTDSGISTCTSNAAFTYSAGTATLGTAGSVVGAVKLKNATSGDVTLQPVTGALGSSVISVPAVTDTMVTLAATQTLTNKTLTAPVISTISNTGTVTLFTATDTVVGKATTDTLTNKTFNTDSTGNVLTAPSFVVLWAGGCQNTTAISYWDLPTSTPAVATCVTGTNIQKGVLAYADTSGGFSAQTSFSLPVDWTTGTLPDIDIFWTTTATTGNAKWTVAIVCTDVAASATDDPAFPTSGNGFNTVITAAPGTASRVQTSTITAATLPTSCVTGTRELIHVRLFRDGNDGSDTLAATANFLNMTMTPRRAM